METQIKLKLHVAIFIAFLFILPLGAKETHAFENEYDQHEMNEALFDTLEPQDVDLELITHLVNQGADINAINEDGQTPLMIAASCCRKEPESYAEIKQLLDLGADKYLQEPSGKTADDLAIEDPGCSYLAFLLA